MRGAVLTRFLDPMTSNLVARNRHRYGPVSHGRLCAGVDYPALIEGDQEFVLFWRTMPCDHAPGALLLSESGGVARRLDGTPYGPTQQRAGFWRQRPKTHGRLSGLLSCALEPRRSR
jgi:fructose-1,6-bisphosphatase/inositol monophosphatase family enzyme